MIVEIRGGSIGELWWIGGFQGNLVSTLSNTRMMQREIEVGGWVIPVARVSDVVGGRLLRRSEKILR